MRKGQSGLQRERALNSLTTDSRVFDPAIITEKQQEAILGDLEPADPITGCRGWKGRRTHDGVPIVMLYDHEERTAIFVTLARVHLALAGNDAYTVPAEMRCKDIACAAAEHVSPGFVPSFVERDELGKRGKRKRKPCGKQGHSSVDLTASGVCRDCHRERRDRVATVASDFGLSASEFMRRYGTSDVILSHIEDALAEGGLEAALIAAERLSR